MSIASTSGSIVWSTQTLRPDPDLTIPARVRVCAFADPERTAVIDGVTGDRLTYASLVAAVDETTAGMSALGITAGDVVAIHAPNSPGWIVAALAAMQCGAAITGVNPAYGPDEVAAQATAAGASYLVSTLAGVEVLPGDLLAAMKGVVTIDGDGPGSLGGLRVAGADVASAAALVGPDACCALPFSSGTSGHPKGVVVTHRSVGAVIDQVNANLPGDGEVVLAFLPMFHIFGFSVVTLAGLCGGATLVTLPTFDPPQFLTAVATHRVTQLFVVPPVMGFLAAHPLVDQFDLDALTLVGCGAAPLPESIEAGVANRLGCEVAQGFGMTESSGIITLPTLSGSRPGSCGLLVAGTEARIVVPGTDDDAAPGDDGELWFRGPQSAAGYLDDPAATAETFGDDGWVRTGDIARFDDDGHLYITDRIKELIKVKGYQVAPAELEALLATHPDVQDAAVVGKADPISGEVPVAFVVGADIDAAEVQAWVADKVVEYKALAEVHVCDVIPKNPSGKILRRVLRDRMGGAPPDR